MNQLISLKERTVIITGAGHFPGMGSQTALDLLDAGAQVVVNSRSIDTEWEVIKQRYTDSLLIVPGDISSCEFQQSLIQKTLERFGTIDHLVNNASTGRAEYDDNGLLSHKTWHDNFMLNVITVYDLSHACLPYLKLRQGSIVNVSSRSALKANVGNNLAYATSKSAMLRLSQQMACDFAPEVTVNAISPGFVDTYRLQTLFGDKYPEWKENWAPKSLITEAISTQSVSALIMMLLSNRGINGQNIPICGGSSIK